MLTRDQIEKFFGPEWVDFFTPFVQSKEFTTLMSALADKKKAGEIIYPAQKDIFRAFKETPLSQLRVVILGMDPYASEGYANGLAFAHLKNMKPARSMEMIIDAIEVDVYNGLKFDKKHFNTELTQWTEQGILLLNSSLTVQKDNPGSHNAIWEPFMEYFCKTLTTVKKSIINLAWGKQAQSYMKHIDIFTNFVNYSEHPAAAARKGEPWNTKAFSWTNAVIIGNKLGEPIKW